MITKMTRRQLRVLIKEVTNYASLEHQGMQTLRNVIRQVINEEDIKTVVGRMAGTIDDSEMHSVNVANWMMSEYNNYYDKISSKITLSHPSLDAVMIDDMGPHYQRRPQEIDRYRIAQEIVKMYGALIEYYIEYFIGPGLFASKE